MSRIGKKAITIPSGVEITANNGVVTVKKGSKSAKRRKSFCARMGGVKGPMKDSKGRPTRKALALRKWKC